MVMFLHTGQNTLGVTGLSKWLFCYGQMGVQLFFVASAFTLCLSWERRSKEENPVSKFFIRRFFRIAPAYYIIGLMGYFLFRTLLWYRKSGILEVPEIYNIPKVLSNIFLVHGFYPPGNNMVVPGGWSIGTEVLFYLLFPIIFPLISKWLSKQNRRIIAFPFYVMGLCSLILLTIYLVGGFFVTNNGFIYFSLLVQAPVFACGFSLYFIQKHDLLKNIATQWLVVVFMMVTAVSIYLGWINPVTGIFSILPLLAGISFIPLFEIFKRIDRLNIPLLGRIGELSYSMYLIHFIFSNNIGLWLNNNIFLKWFSPTLSHLCSYSVTLLGTFLFAQISEKIIEKPFIRLGKKIISSFTPSMPHVPELN